MLTSKKTIFLNDRPLKELRRRRTVCINLQFGVKFRLMIMHDYVLRPKKLIGTFSIYHFYNAGFVIYSIMLLDWYKKVDLHHRGLKSLRVGLLLKINWSIIIWMLVLISIDPLKYRNSKFFAEFFASRNFCHIRHEFPYSWKTNRWW